MRWVAAKGRGLFDRDGRCIRVIGTAIDITRRKITEAALVESERRFRQLAEVSPQFIAVANAHGTIEFVNRRWTAYSGLDLIATQDAARCAQAFHPDDRAEVLGRWQTSRASGEPLWIECRLRGMDGQFRWFMIRAVALREEAGQVEKWFAVATDIHDHKRVEEDLRRANQDLEQFAYSASHDLQEPLRSIKIYAELLTILSQEKLDGEALQALGFIRTGANRMEMLLRGLLNYTQAALLESAPDLVDAGECLNAALQNLSEAIAESAATIHRGELPHLRVHSTQLQQLFQNLIGNAIKYTQPGTPPRVEISADGANGQWCFAVKDNGIGIEDEYQERIFGLFKRLHTQDDYPGTGIGLALCQRIVQYYNGRIWVESKPGKGSTFYFTLPA
jgi:PAS domain S-box-containing protein